MFYSGSGGNFNLGLAPARSEHLEVGAKAFVGDNSCINLALFQIRTQDELVVDVATGGRTSYKNAGDTLRQGLELAFDTAWTRSLSSRFALSHLRAVYDGAFTSGTGASLKTIEDGKYIPGVPRTTSSATPLRRASAARVRHGRHLPQPYVRGRHQQRQRGPRLRHRQPAPERRTTHRPMETERICPVDNLLDRTTSARWWATPTAAITNRPPGVTAWWG